MMTDEDIANALHDVKDAVDALTAGLMKMLDVMARQGAILDEVRAAVTKEPDGKSPLVEAVEQLVKNAETQNLALARIERAVADLQPR